MLKKVEFEAKSLDEALDFAVEKLKIQKEKIKITIIKEKKGLFSSGKGLYEAKPNINLPLEGKKYLEEILSELGLEYKMEMLTKEDGKAIEYKVQTNENARAIGKDGRTLLSIQSVLRNYMSTFTQEKIRVSLDIGEYYSKHRKHLEILATKSAKKVAQSGQEIRLKPMNAYDRRVIHEKLSEWRDVETLSEGENPRRFVIIKTKEK